MVKRMIIDGGIRIKDASPAEIADVTATQTAVTAELNVPPYEPPDNINDWADDEFRKNQHLVIQKMVREIKRLRQRVKALEDA